MASSKKKIPVPIKIGDVTEDWLLEAMTASLGRSDVEVNKIEVITDHDAYMSQALRAEIKLDKDNRVLPLFIKVGVAEDNPVFSYVVDYNTDKKEVKAYKEYLPRLVRFAQKHANDRAVVEEMIPRVYAAEYRKDESGERGFFIIMEDLKVNYEMKKANDGDGLSLKQLQLCLSRIARFHSVSYAYSKVNKKPWVLDDYYNLGTMMDDPSILEAMVIGLDKAATEFKTMDNGNELAEKLEAMHASGDVLKPAVLTTIEKDDRFLIHADYWSNNVIFSKKSSKIKIYDWQAITPGHPQQDFSFIVFFCTNPDNVESWMDKLYDAYYDAMRATCKKFKVPLPFTKEDFVKKVEKIGYTGLFSWILLAYDDMKKLAPVERMLWVGNQALKHNPDFFKV